MDPSKCSFPQPIGGASHLTMRRLGWKGGEEADNEVELSGGANRILLRSKGGSKRGRGSDASHVVLA